MPAAVAASPVRHAPSTAEGRPKLLLVGEVGHRPDGLERALIRSGLEIAEAELGAPLRAVPDVVLLTAAGEVDAAGALEILRHRLPGGVPIVVTLDEGDSGSAVRVLEAGAADVVPGSALLPELCSRLFARVRGSRDAATARLHADQASRLFDIFQDIALANRGEEILHTLVQRLGDVLDLSHCACVFIAPGQEDARLIAVHENPKIRDLPVELAQYPEAREAARSSATAFVADVSLHPIFLRLRTGWQKTGILPDVRSAAAIPIVQQGKIIGTVVMRSRIAQPLHAEQLRFAERLVQGTARVLESLDRRAAIFRRQATTAMVDPLTGCASLDALDRRLKEEFERSRRYGLCFSLVLLDVEGLAALNERLGMEAGDRFLADLGSILQREIRGPDFVARYGGDEFALVLPETSVEGARRTIARIRSRLEQGSFSTLSAAERPVLTGGLVTFPHPAVVHTEDLFALAETALIRAKAEGGERVAAADPVAA